MLKKIPLVIAAILFLSSCTEDNILSKSPAVDKESAAWKVANARITEECSQYNGKPATALKMDDCEQEIIREAVLPNAFWPHLLEDMLQEWSASAEKEYERKITDEQATFEQKRSWDKYIRRGTAAADQVRQQMYSNLMQLNANWQQQNYQQQMLNLQRQQLQQQQRQQQYNTSCFQGGGGFVNCTTTGN